MTSWRAQVASLKEDLGRSRQEMSDHQQLCRIKRRQRSRAALKRKRVKVISDLLISISKPERQEARAKVRHDSLRLGIVGVIRAGTIISETWEDGEALKDLNSHLVCIFQPFVSLEQLGSLVTCLTRVILSYILSYI